MSRRGGLIEEVTNLPWLVGVGFAVVIVFLVQAWLWFFPESIDTIGVETLTRSIVQWGGYGFACLFLTGGLLSLLMQVKRGQRFKATKSIAEIRSLTWKQFESFVGEAFRLQGYTVVETREGPDNGIDLVLRKDGEKTYVQCKHWKTNQVGVEKVRELLGSMAAGGAQNGIFVASGTYTQPAREFARECGIRLIDGEQLASLLAEAQPAESTVDSQSGLGPELACPICSAPMVKRVAKRGTTAGNSFWGCSKYPRCRGTRR